MRYRSISEMPEGLRKLFDAQYQVTEDGKIVERQKRITVHQPKQEIRLTEIPNPESFLPNPEITWTPHRAMNVGADEIALKDLNATETRYLEILRGRPGLVWIGVKTMRFRLAGNTHYTPDFQTISEDGVMTQIDTKGGHTWEDAQLKMKLVARMFPFFRWQKVIVKLATKKRPEEIKEMVFPG